MSGAPDTPDDMFYDLMKKIAWLRMEMSMAQVLLLSCLPMGQPLRYYEPNTIYEITTRTIQGRRLLRPSPEANEIIAGIIGRAQRIYPAVQLYGVVVLSNHCTWLLSSTVPGQIPDFMGYINGNISREIGRLHDWPGKLWERPHRPIPVLDEASLVARFKYLLSQGCKEDLVESPCDWPGVSCVQALLGKGLLYGWWFDRDLATKARRRGHKPEKYEFATRYTVKFAKLPCWAELSDAQYAQCVAELVTEIESEAGAERERSSKQVMGAKALCRVHPHERPQKLAKSPAPLCHAVSLPVRQEFRKRYREFVRVYRAAAKRLLEGLWPWEFPAGCFPSRPAFVHIQT